MERTDDASESWQRITDAWHTCRSYLLNEQTPDGHWVGQLSTSALSTATAVSAMVVCRTHGCIDIQIASTVDAAIESGCQWLLAHQNADGGWGDTDRSHSNIATTLLAIAAHRLATGESSDQHSQIVSAWQYVEQQGRWQGLRRRYGKDKTFVVPILSNCALAGLVPWKSVAALPFEAAWLPQQWYRLARMPVVSYAIPALVAIGQARFHFRPPWFVPWRWLRAAAVQPTLKVLAKMQPASGGYLEATPLTSFVLMNLAAIGHGNLTVAQNCLRFILDSRLEDGSWPIDTNLATWGTSLAWHALSRTGSIRISDSATNSSDASCSVDIPSGVTLSRSALQWLLSCQHREQHPFTGAIPGGWGWTDLSGAVPDADDTPAALLALSYVDWDEGDAEQSRSMLEAVGMGLRWLVQLQNRDGGWPTFCRGWGKLPFDRSGTDLTAHALRAIKAWRAQLASIAEACATCPTAAELDKAVRRGLSYVQRTQLPDGSWLPLWFGNQDRPLEDNPFYGTGKVLVALAKFEMSDHESARKAVQFLRANQNPDGGWGGSWTRLSGRDKAAGTSSIEETAIVLEGLIENAGQSGADSTIMAGLDWLAHAIQSGGLAAAEPIGFYFAKLWYHEKLYPALFGLSALGAAVRGKRTSVS